MNNVTAKWKTVKDLLVYQPPSGPGLFVLGDERDGAAGPKPNELKKNLEEHIELIRYAGRVGSCLEKAVGALSDPSVTEARLSAIQAELAALEDQRSKVSPLLLSYEASADPLDVAISSSLEENRKALEHLYNLPDNKALVLRDIVVPADPPLQGTLAFIPGLVDKAAIHNTVLQPLLLLNPGNHRLFDKDVARQLVNSLLPAAQVKIGSTMRDVADRLNLGDTALFLDGVSEALLVDTKGGERRGVERPNTEQAVRGSQASFTESVQVNTSLVRSLLRSCDLTTETLTIGERSNTPCSLMYIQSIANPVLVKEARRRLQGIKTDILSVSGTGMVQQVFDDFPNLPFPQSLITERPDRVAAALAEGRLAILVDGSPFALVAPISMFTLFHSPDDFSFNWIAGTFIRLLRVVAALLTVVTPALYIAISYFHQEAIPTDLLLAIAGARERVPFPSILEIIMMEFSFELLREAGVRIPGMLGSTIGIVGAIILGQAAVAASIVSPITVVIIAVTGLASFAITDYSLAFAFRLTRFIFELLAAMLGLVGVAGGLIVLAVMLCAVKSLGVPYLSPVAPKTTQGFDVVLRGPVFSQELRPDELNPQDIRRQPSVSRKWTGKKPAWKEDE